MSQTTHEQLKHDCQHCRRCPELVTTRKHVVFGEGSTNAQIMLVGEAPGQKEDQLQRPFVGKAGQILTEVLSHIPLKRTTLYITSCVKCRPPKNRKPRKQEITNCKPWLKTQISLIHPQIIVLLGNVATQTMINITGISKHHGKIIRTPSTHYLITYHPAAILYQRKLQHQLITDLKQIPHLLNKLPQKPLSLNNNHTSRRRKTSY